MSPCSAARYAVALGPAGHGLPRNLLP